MDDEKKKATANKFLEALAELNSASRELAFVGLKIDVAVVEGNYAANGCEYTTVSAYPYEKKHWGKFPC